MAEMHNEEMEQVVLGVLIGGKNQAQYLREAGRSLQPQDFYHRDHQALFTVLMDMHAQEQAIDAVTVWDRLKTDKVPIHREIGWGTYVAELDNQSFRRAYFPAYTQALVAFSRRRQLHGATQRLTQRAASGEPLDTLTQDMAAEVESLTPPPKEETPEDLGLVLASDLANMVAEDHEYVVDGLLPKGWLSLMVADPKCGKSMVARNLIAAIMSGGSWLGRNVEHQGHVLYLAWEEGPDDVWRHFTQMHVDLTQAPMVLSFSRGRRDPQDWADWLSAAVQQVRPALVVIDTLARLIPFEDVNDYGKAMTSMTALLDIARQSEAHIMALHHTRKAGGEHGSESMGSQAIYASADMMIRLTRDKEQRYISTDGRPHDRIVEPVALIWDDSQGTISVGETMSQIEHDALEDEVYALLKRTAEPLRIRDIREVLHKRNSAIHRAVLALVKRGFVEQFKDGQSNLFRLFPDDTGTGNS